MIASTLLILADTAIWQRRSRSPFAHYANVFCGNYCFSYCISLGAVQKSNAAPTSYRPALWRVRARRSFTATAG